MVHERSTTFIPAANTASSSKMSQAQRPSRSRNRDTQDTQNTMTQAPALRKIRQSNRRQSSFLDLHPLPSVSEEATSTETEVLGEPTTRDTRYVELDILDDRVEIITSDDSEIIRVSLESGQWLELQTLHPHAEDERPATYTITTGQDLKEGIDPATVNELYPHVTISDEDQLGSAVAQFPQWFHAALVRIMTAVGLLAEGHDTLSKQARLPPSTVPRQLYDEKMNRIRNLEAQIEKLKGKNPSSDNPDEINEHPAYITLQAELQELRTAGETYRNSISKLEDTQDVNEDEIEKLKDELEHEKSEADRFYKDWKTEREVAAAERQRATDEKKKADRYYIDRTNRDADYEDVNRQLGDEQTSKVRLQREYDVVLNKLLAHEPNYKPYSILQRDYSDPNDRRRRDTPFQNGERNGRATSILTNRTRRDDADRPLREDAHRPRRDDAAHNRRDEATRLRRDDVDRRDERQSTPFMAPERRRQPTASLHDQALNSVTGTSGGVTIRLPDISVFKGEDEGKDEDYEKWRRSAVNKCSTYVNDHAALIYLEDRIKGNAWDLIKYDITSAKSYLDILEVMDEHFGAETYEKEMEAEALLRDQHTLVQKQGEAFVNWRQRFLKVHAILQKSDREMVGYARQYMRPGLAAATTAGSVRGETLTSFLNRARDRDLDQKEINRHSTPTAKKTERERDSRKTPRRRSPGDRSPERKRASNRTAKRSVGFGRTNEQRDVLFKNKACFKCGDKAHRSNDCTKTTAVPFDQIKGLSLNAMDAEFTDDEDVADDTRDHSDHDHDEHQAYAEDEVDDEGYVVNPEYEARF